MAEFNHAQQILAAMAAGWTLKAQRDIEGRKEFWLHPLEGKAVAVEGAVVAALVEEGLIDSNKKFPAATFWLTERGKREAG